MSVLIIGQTEKSAIVAALAKARTNPIPLEILRAGATTQPIKVLNLADRNPFLVRPDSEHVMLGTYRAAISFECQPHGLCKHLSISSATLGKIPNEIVILAVAKAFGFYTSKDDKGNEKISDARAWLEEFDPGHYAVNMVQPDAV